MACRARYRKWNDLVVIGSHSAFQSGCLLFIALCKMCAWQTSCRTILAGDAAPSPVHPPALAHFGIEPACAIRPFRRSITSWTWRFPPLHQGRTMGNRFGRLITSQGPSSYPTPMTRKTSVPPLPHSTKSVPVLGNRQRAFAPLKHACCFGRGDEGPQSRKSSSDWNTPAVFQRLRLPTT